MGADRNIAIPMIAGMRDNLRFTANNAVSWRVIVVHSDGAVRSLICNMLEGGPQSNVAGSFSDGHSALAALPRVQPNLVVTGLELTDMSGLDVVRALVNTKTPCASIVVAGIGDEVRALEAFQAGARGYLLKERLAVELSRYLASIKQGGWPVSPTVARQLTHHLRRTCPEVGTAAHLTLTETRVLARIARGHSYEETAQLLGVKPSTIHAHLKNIYRKLNVHSNVQAVSEALRLKIPL